MNAGNDHVQLGQQGILAIQSAVLEDVHLDPGQQAKLRSFVGKFRVELFDLLELLAQAGGVQTVGLEFGLRVVCDAPISEAHFDH